MPTFIVTTPVGFDQLALQDIMCDAVRTATKKGYLRQNSVDSLSGRNSGTNLGPGSPVFHWHQHRKDVVDIRLILKGGGWHGTDYPSEARKKAMESEKKATPTAEPAPSSTSSAAPTPSTASSAPPNSTSTKE